MPETDYKRHLRHLKENHALQCNVTQNDEHYRKVLPELTEDQKLQLLSEEEARKIFYAERDRADKSWRERRYADKTDREEWLW